MNHPEPYPWLQPLPLPGGHRLPCRVLPGPMEGITAGSFCQIMMRRQLVGAWITPFIRISTGVPRLARLKERLAAFHPPAADAGVAVPPVIVQLMGENIPLLCATARRLAELGVAGIDLNCACPSPIVVRHGAGGARLAHPGWIRDALTALRQACPNTGISVKLRAGLYQATELPGILAAVREAKPDFTCLHFRTVPELYHDVPGGWDRLKRARDLLPDQILFAAGDVFTPRDALGLYQQTGVDGVTPARGILRNPWLLTDILNTLKGSSFPIHTTDEKLDFLREFELLWPAERLARGRNPCPGPIIELAKNLLGMKHPVVQEWMHPRAS
ncbi:MAG: tRNA-dihydrouridine synthase family protein [Lentisphaeria bacterium]